MDLVLSLPWGILNPILRFKIRDSAANTGAGKTGITGATSGLIISTFADNEASATTYTASGTSIDTITTIGTYAAPSANHCNFKQIDATNNPGVYELQLAAARFAVAASRFLNITVSGASGGAQTDILVNLSGPFNPVNALGGGDAIYNTTIATLASQTSFTLTNGSADNTAYVGCILIIRKSTNPAQIAVGVVNAYTGASKTVTLAADPAVYTMGVGDYVTVLPPNATTAEIKAALNGATLTLKGSTFIGTMTISIP